jgi:hypothetical protein
MMTEVAAKSFVVDHVVAAVQRPVHVAVPVHSLSPGDFAAQRIVRVTLAASPFPDLVQAAAVPVPAFAVPVEAAVHLHLVAASMPGPLKMTERTDLSPRSLTPRAQVWSLLQHTLPARYTHRNHRSHFAQTRSTLIAF